MKLVMVEMNDDVPRQVAPSRQRLRRRVDGGRTNFLIGRRQLNGDG